MSREKINQIIDEVYERYSITAGMSTQVLSLTKESFINKCKTKPEFSETWGLKIEERELSLEERMSLCKEKWDYSWNRTINLEDIEWRMNNEWNTPTRLITLTYKKNKIESYEQ